MVTYWEYIRQGTDENLSNITDVKLVRNKISTNLKPKYQFSVIVN